MQDDTAPDLAAIAEAAAAHHLAVLGGFHPAPGDAAPRGCRTLILLGPGGARFWPHVTASAEFADGAPDPLDRWSARVIGALARHLGAEAAFPFGGPPWPPFLSWARRTGRAWQSPVGLLVHETHGLMVSYRGALALPWRIALPPPPAGPPCATCDAPCLRACPVDALGTEGYDLAACHGALDTGIARNCMTAGCAARRACPLSPGAKRSPAQSAWHMQRFHP